MPLQRDAIMLMSVLMLACLNLRFETLPPATVGRDYGVLQAGLTSNIQLTEAHSGHDRWIFHCLLQHDTSLPRHPAKFNRQQKPLTSSKHTNKLNATALFSRYLGKPSLGLQSCA